MVNVRGRTVLALQRQPRPDARVGGAGAHGVRLHTHRAENDHDIAYSRQHFGATPSEYAAELVWVGRDG